MDPMRYSPEDTFGRLRNLLTQLKCSEPFGICKLTKGKIKQAVGEGGGIYLFSEKDGDVPVYVGRSDNLAQRVGKDHRSLEENQAAVTKRLKERYGLPTMSTAREKLYHDYVVRLRLEPDIPSRAMFEIFAAMDLNTEFNTFKEH